MGETPFLAVEQLNRLDPAQRLEKMAVAPRRPDDGLHGGLPQRRVERPAQQAVEEGARQDERSESRRENEHDGESDAREQPVEHGLHHVRGDRLQNRLL